MDATNRRPWEAGSPVPQPQTQTLPSIETLTRDVDKRSKDQNTPLSSTLSAPRDSGNWSAHSSSILTSSQGNNMPFLNQPTNTSPSGPYTPDGSNGHTFSANHSAHPSNASGPGDRGSGDFDYTRRGSVDSRIHQGFRNMDLGPTSPYNASANASQSSLVQGLARERGILTNGYRGPRSSTGSGGGPMSPSWPRTAGSGGVVPGRVAPPIRNNPGADIAFTERPLRGQAWAFPDPDAPQNRAPSTFSRRNSFAESLASSIYSDRSRLPPGQHELPGETHHHSLQHRQVESLRGDPDSPNSTTPYSRTPELRVTHKLAERKRRSEMKDCFEQLRQKLPSNQNNKTSKWETLARAIEYISSLEGQVKSHRIESDKQRHQIHDLEIQMKELAQQVQRLSHGSSYSQPNSIPQNQHAYGHGQAYTNGADTSKEPPRTLPPIMNGAMQGVQYGNDERR